MSAASTEGSRRPFFVINLNARPTFSSLCMLCVGFCLYLPPVCVYVCVCTCVWCVCVRAYVCICVTATCVRETVPCITMSCHTHLQHVCTKQEQKTIKYNKTCNARSLSRAELCTFIIHTHTHTVSHKRQHTSHTRAREHTQTHTRTHMPKQSTKHVTHDHYAELHYAHSSYAHTHTVSRKRQHTSHTHVHESIHRHIHAHTCQKTIIPTLLFSAISTNLTSITPLWKSAKSFTFSFRECNSALAHDINP